MSNKVKSDDFSGVYPAVLIPMKADLSCDHDALVEHINDLHNQGCNGVVLFGTTGEGTSFSVRERINTLETVIQRGIPSNRIIVGIGCSSIEDTVDLTRAAVENKCSSVLMHPPFYFKGLQDEGIVNFYREVIRRVSRPELKLFLYHIPQFTYAPISLNVIQVLKNEFPETVIGIKDSSGNIAFTRSVLTTFPCFKVMLGSELKIPDLIREGANGIVSGLANICPQLIANQFHCGKNSDFIDKEQDVINYLNLIKNYHFISALKTLLAVKKGNIWKLVRPPLLTLNDGDSKELVDNYNKFD